MGQRVNNYDKQAELARAEFLKYDQTEMIRRFGLEHDTDSIYISFFGELHRIDRVAGKVYRSFGESAGFNAVMTIYDVLCYSKSGAYLSGRWQVLSNLSPHSNFGAPGKSLYSQTALQFSGKLDVLKRVCAALGGAEDTKADVGYRFDAFSFLPVIFQFWDGDDEFDPRINFLFDANTLDYIHFETAWYAAGYLLELIDANMPV